MNRALTIRKSENRGLIGLAVLLIAVQAHAATVLTAACGPPAGEVFEGPGSGTCVTGILNLDVLGTIYDVEIVVDTGANVFGSPTTPSPVPTFWGDQAGAAAAVTAIVNALNSEGGIAGATGVAGSRYWIDIPWGTAYSNLAVEFANGTGASWFYEGTGACGFNVGCSAEGWALFTPVVPVPAAVWLFGSALGLMGVMRRKLAS
jgi:hypothetical protein